MLMLMLVLLLLLLLVVVDCTIDSLLEIPVESLPGTGAVAFGLIDGG